jgi:hypothetical protein
MYGLKTGTLVCPNVTENPSKKRIFAERSSTSKLPSLLSSTWTLYVIGSVIFPESPIREFLTENLDIFVSKAYSYLVLMLASNLGK